MRRIAPAIEARCGHRHHAVTHTEIFGERVRLHVYGCPNSPTLECEIEDDDGELMSWPDYGLSEETHSRVWYALAEAHSDALVEMGA